MSPPPACPEPKVYNRLSNLKGCLLSRVIRTESAASQRKQWMRSLALALRRGLSGDVEDDEKKDLLAFMMLTLEQINASVDQTAQAWEKRGYWLKADRFRLEWDWSLSCYQELEGALSTHNWENARAAIPKMLQGAMDVDVPKRLKDAQPWTGAWDEFCRR
jgi:hypothetical protein